MGRRACCEWDQKDLRAAPGILIRRGTRSIWPSTRKNAPSLVRRRAVEHHADIVETTGIDQVALAVRSALIARRPQAFCRDCRRGDVLREVDPENRRTKRAFLTEQGTTMLFEMQQSIDEAHEQLVKPLTH